MLRSSADQADVRGCACICPARNLTSPNAVCCLTKRPWLARAVRRISWRVWRRSCHSTLSAVRFARSAGFERLVFVMPAALDKPRTDDGLSRVVEMADCVENGDVEALTALLLEAEPASVRTRHGVKLWCRRQAAAMVGTPVSQALRALPNAVPLTERGVLAEVTTPALVIAQEQDPAHPVLVAEQLAASLPDARLEVMAPGGLMWRHRALMRDLIGGFLSGEPRRHSCRPSQSTGGRPD